MRARGLTLSLGGRGVLHGIDLDVPAGRRSVLVGPAASGKSVLMKCLAGIYPPDGGSIEIDGQPITGNRVNHMRSTGILFQQGGLFDSLSVWENIAFKLINTFGMARAQARTTALEHLRLVNLPASTGDLKPSQISGGMQKRVGLARALAGSPTLLLLDEPTAGLDPITTAAIDRLISRTSAEIGATVLAITSNMHSARTAYDHMFMLNAGEIVWSGPADEIDTCGNPYVDQLVRGNAEGPIQMRVHARS